MNQFAGLSSEKEVDRLAQITTEEIDSEIEYQEYLDSLDDIKQHEG